MNETTPPDAEANSEDFRRRRLANSILVAALVVVGVLGSVAMLYELYGPTTKSTQPPREGPSGQARSASAVAPGGKSGYALRLHAFSDVANAEDLRAKLDALQIPSTISVEAHVQVGPFKTQEEVNAARVKLKELGIYGGELVTIK
ncbi:MAG: SPOR domain-containing protein [Sulfuritalea sp.]|nr:SPOR domain-containing protein [Sulfuritalea sp.]